VDYYLFIMVMKVESLEGMEITSAAPRRSFPLQSLISQASVSCFCVLVALPFAMLGQDESIETKIDGIGAMRWERVGPTRPGHLATWTMPVSSLDLLCCTSFSLKFCSVEKLAPAEFQVICTPFGSMKVKNIEKVVFWFSQVNPIKLENL
jgi:hypothetical protein